MATVTDIKGDGWVHVTGDNGQRYMCQTTRENWWARISGYVTIHDVGEGPETAVENRIPHDVILAVNVACPNRRKPYGLCQQCYSPFGTGYTCVCKREVR